jgi:type IV pilus assembly protein PilV
MLNGDDVMSQISFSPKSTQSGVVLIEAMVAILLFSIGILAVAGLQASMLRNTGDARYRADASYIAQQSIGLLWSNVDDIDNAMAPLNTSLPGLPGGQRLVSKDATGKYTVTIGWTAPGEPVDPDMAAHCGIDVAHCYSVIAGISPY